MRVPPGLLRCSAHDLPAVDEYGQNMGITDHGVAVAENHVGVLAHFQRTHSVRHAQVTGGVEGDGLSAWKGSIPAFTASPAHRGRYCWGITGASVMILTWTPALASTPGVSKVLFVSSILLALVRVGPTAAGKPERPRCPG